jgi:glutathione synthase/RimK-type ligase-like ATP-grasp enzyme
MYNGRTIHLDAITAAWYRRPSSFFCVRPDKGSQLTLDTERKALQYSLWDAVAERCWLNAPTKLLHAEHKLTQLDLARKVGFTIPDTVVTNGWQPIHDTLPEQILFKTTYSHTYSRGKLQLVWATPFSNERRALPVKGNPFPGLWQPYLRKAREWRITVVGRKTFDAAIYTDNDAKDDWVRHQRGPNVRFRHGTFPAAEKEKCFKFLNAFGLAYGAFDFVETDDGQIIFLECNPNGQYGWLEDELGLPISESIADELVAIAEATSS